MPVANSNAASVIRAGSFGAGRLPPQPSGDHQVQDEEELALERDDDPLAESPHVEDDLAFDLADRWHRGAQHERIAIRTRRSRCERMRSASASR